MNIIKVEDIKSDHRIFKLTVANEFDLPSSHEMKNSIIPENGITENDYIICICQKSGLSFEYSNDNWSPATLSIMKNLDEAYDLRRTSNRTAEEFGTVTALGSGNTKYSDDYDPSVLETFKNKHPESDYIVTFDAYEFTSKCPKTGQPDFAKIIISYIPSEDMVESKSLKLYLFSFRNHGDFHEDCINIIMSDLISLMDPKYIEVRGIFSPRGGISIFPFVNYADPRYNYQDFAKQRKLDALRDASNRKIRYDM